MVRKESNQRNKANLSSTIKPYGINCISFNWLVPLIYTYGNSKQPTRVHSWKLTDGRGDRRSMGIIEPLPLVMDDCLSYDLGQHDNLLYVSHYVSSENPIVLWFFRVGSGPPATLLWTRARWTMHSEDVIDVNYFAVYADGHIFKIATSFVNVL